MIAALSSRIAWGNALSPPGVIRSVVLSFLLPLVAALALMVRKKAEAAVALFVPIVALGLSTLFEGLSWTPLGLSGVLLVAAGNVLAVTRKRSTARQAPVLSAD